MWGVCMFCHVYVIVGVCCVYSFGELCMFCVVGQYVCVYVYIIVCGVCIYRHW
jgi:hypothetical protein